MPCGIADCARSGIDTRRGGHGKAASKQAVAPCFAGAALPQVRRVGCFPLPRPLLERWAALLLLYSSNKPLAGIYRPASISLFRSLFVFLLPSVSHPSPVSCPAWWAATSRAVVKLTQRRGSQALARLREGKQDLRSLHQPFCSSASLLCSSGASTYYHDIRDKDIRTTEGKGASNGR